MFVVHRFTLSDNVKEEFQKIKPNFGYNGFGAAVFYRTYSRRKSDGGMESWNDVVIRVVEGTFSIRKDWYLKNHIKWDEEFWAHYAYHFGLSMLRMEWLPPGRGLWAMGTDFVYEEGSMSLYNCAFTTIGEDIGADIEWLMDSLMLGVGVGFSPTRDDELIVKSSTEKYNYLIPDSREGWAEATKLLINSFTKGTPFPIFDYSAIREQGTPIKRFGGECSGPEPLIKLHKKIEDFFYMYQTEDWYDSVLLKADIANSVGCCVVAGNVRRSAEIALLGIDDPTFINLKDYTKYPYRGEFGWMSNNSVILEEDKDFGKLGEVAQRVIRNGEPGILNKKNFPFGRIGKDQEGVKRDSAEGLNPCQIASAKVLTPSGIRQFKDIDVGSFIWSQNGWCKVVKKWSTGINPTYCYRTTAGAFYGTAGHKVVSNNFKIKVELAQSIDILNGPVLKDKVNYSPHAIMDGLVIGDGTDSHGVICLCIGENDQDYYTSEVKGLIGSTYDKSYYRIVDTSIVNLPLTYKRQIPEKYFYTNDKNQLVSFLRGLYSANGSICGNRITLKAASFRIIEDVQTMLSSIGIRSYYTTNKPSLISWSNGEFESKQSYDLNISEDRKLFATLIGFIQKYKQKALDELINRVGKGVHKDTYDIVSVTDLGEQETFDITVDNSTHTYWTQCLNVSNCGEIPLNNKEVCNIAETYPTMCADINSWYKAIEYATMYMSTVSLLPTHQESTNQVVARNRRIGCGIVDYTGWIKANGLHKVIPWMREGYKKARLINQWLNGEAGVPDAIRVTTIKPGGTTPKLPGKTSGIGYPNFLHTVRRMRVARGSTIAKILTEAGYPIEPDAVSDNTDVVEFPILQGPAKPATEATLWEQAMNLVTVQREWADNAVSNTLNFKPKWVLKKVINRSECLVTVIDTYTSVITEENAYKSTMVCNVDGHQKYKFEIGPDQVHIYEYDPRHEEGDIEAVLSSIAPLTKSVSLLPQTSAGVYKQMPEEGISEEEYENRLLKIKPINWNLLHQSNVVGPIAEVDKYCDGDQCTIRNVK